MRVAVALDEEVEGGIVDDGGEIVGESIDENPFHGIARDNDLLPFVENLGGNTTLSTSDVCCLVL